MKHLKKIIFTAVLAAALSTSAFAASGFEFILNVPLGLSIGIPELPAGAPKDVIKGGVGFDAGVTAQLGYMIGITEGVGISILGEIGYAHDTSAYSIDGYAITGMDGVPRINLSQSFESIQIGLLPKVNIGAFAIGIGGGIKIPMASTINLKYGDTDAGSLKLNMNDIGTMYSTALIGYIKGTFDYSIFFTDKIAMNIGLYLGYDFMPKIATDGSVSAPFLDGGTFDIGLQLGFKFGPKA
ncbi:hypothetical protein [Brachyspira hampsonii]|uniref:hypothetical protein n=1 Tax=Brachyspira hampsonii TaxID=1287055 RepID=UPI000D366276|nr:hypothetical protein [Brachyspira hampsonii]PTY40971.1 hypothetical protein DQ06_10640 [Brachyspira hampsonii bv. II]